jgi:hypothetical protein
MIPKAQFLVTPVSPNSSGGGCCTEVDVQVSTQSWPRLGVSPARGVVNECFIHIDKRLLSKDLHRKLQRWDS